MRRERDSFGAHGSDHRIVAAHQLREGTPRVLDELGLVSGPAQYMIR
jgi:hypothetical protein